MEVIPREVEIKRPITWSREIREMQKRIKLKNLFFLNLDINFFIFNPVET